MTEGRQLRNLGRKVTLALVGLAGVLSIMATSRFYEYDFGEIEASPHYRCPGADVTLRWRMTKPAPIVIRVADREIRPEPGASRAVLPASLFDGAGPVTPVTVEIVTDDPPYPASFEIKTPLVRPVESTQFMRGPLHPGAAFGFDLRSDNYYDDRLLVVGLRLNPPRDDAYEPIEGLRWTLQSEGGADIPLGPENGYDIAFDQPAPMAGIWRFRLDHLPEEQAHDHAQGGECDACELVTVDLRLLCPGG